MSAVFPILHISFTAILPAITLFNDYYLSCLHGSVPKKNKKWGFCTPNKGFNIIQAQAGNKEKVY